MSLEELILEISRASSGASAHSYPSSPLLLRSNLPSPTDLRRLASLMQVDALQAIGNIAGIVRVFEEVETTLLDIAETLEAHDKIKGGTSSVSSQEEPKAPPDP